MTVSTQNLKKHILIVEDDEAIRQILSEILEFEGYDSSTAVNGQDALEKLKINKQRPDLILLDMRMPILNGRQFLNIIKTDVVLKDIPILVVSATADSEDIHGAEGFVKKPIDPAILLQMIATHTVPGDPLRMSKV